MADMLIDHMWDDPFGDEDQEGLVPTFITCRYCKASALEWEKVGGKWRLFETSGKMHACKVKPLPEPAKPKVLTDPIEIAYQKGYDAGYAACAAQAWPDVGM